MIENIRDKLIKSVKQKLRSDVKLAFTLSGGIDSSAILALAQSKVSSPLIAFNLSFDKKHKDYDESSFAKSTAEYLGAKFKKIEINSTK